MTLTQAKLAEAIEAMGRAYEAPTTERDHDTQVDEVLSHVAKVLRAYRNVVAQAHPSE